jgi:hypothetical protein
MFAPLAKDLANWAGIPRKGWHIRMLFQRWITEARENELKSFWKEAISATDPVLGPSAIVVAIPNAVLILFLSITGAADIPPVAIA